MREVNLDDPATAATSAAPTHSFCIYGPTRSGKTTFAATFPRPIFLSDATEAGWESIRNMDPSTFFEAGRKPRVIALEKVGDLVTAMAQVTTAIQNGTCRTVVFDSLTFYADMYLANMAAVQTTPDNRALYGQLGSHLRDLRVKITSAPINTVFLCLDRTADEANPVGGPMIPGQQGQKFAAGCNFLLYARRKTTKSGAGVVEAFELYAKPYGMNMAGSRLGVNADNFPNPFTGTYADLITCLGYDVDAVRAQLTKVAAPVAVPAPVAKAVVSAPRVTTPPTSTARALQARATVSQPVRR